MIDLALTESADGGSEEFDDFFASDSAGGSYSGVGSALAPDPDGTGDLPLPPRLGILENLTHAEFDVVARSAKLTHCEAQTTVVIQGEDADRFFILVDGAADVFRNGKKIATLEPGSFFGESALFRNGMRTATVVTSSPSSLWSICYSTFEETVFDRLLEDTTARAEIDARLHNDKYGN